MWALSREYEDWDEIEENYFAIKEQEFEQVNMPELWSRIEEKLDQSQEQKETDNKNVKKNKKTRVTLGRKVAVMGTVAAAALLVFASYSVMQSGVGESSEQMLGVEKSSNSSASLSEGALQEEETDGELSKWKEKTETSAKEESVEDSIANYESGAEMEIKGNSGDMAETATRGNVILLYVEKVNGLYEFSVNLEKYCLQFIEISVNKKEDVLEVAYSEFSASAQEKLQDEIEDISDTAFYVDSEGALYIEKEDRYYEIYLEEKGDGFDGK